VRREVQVKPDAAAEDGSSVLLPPVRFRAGFRIPLAQLVPDPIIRNHSAMNDTGQNRERRIALFQRKEIRRAIHNNEWWFVIFDVVAALTDSVNPKGYFTDMRRRDPQLAEAVKGGGNLPPPLGLEFDTAGGRQMLQCWNSYHLQFTNPS
jgi:hypothetical protein